MYIYIFFLALLEEVMAAAWKKQSRFEGAMSVHYSDACAFFQPSTFFDLQWTAQPPGLLGLRLASLDPTFGRPGECAPLAKVGAGPLAPMAEPSPPPPLAALYAAVEVAWPSDDSPASFVKNAAAKEVLQGFVEAHSAGSNAASQIETLRNYAVQLTRASGARHACFV